MLLRVLFFETFLKSNIPGLLLINPVWYEIAAFLLFIFAPLSTVWLAHRPQIFKTRRQEKFYKEISKEIAQGEVKNIQAAFEVLIANFESICIVIKGVDKKASELARVSINHLLNEEGLVEILTTKRLDSLIWVFECIEKHEPINHTTVRM